MRAHLSFASADYATSRLETAHSMPLSEPLRRTEGKKRQTTLTYAQYKISGTGVDDPLCNSGLRWVCFYMFRWLPICAMSQSLSDIVADLIAAPNEFA